MKSNNDVSEGIEKQSDLPNEVEKSEAKDLPDEVGSSELDDLPDEVGDKTDEQSRINSAIGKIQTKNHEGRSPIEESMENNGRMILPEKVS